MAINFDPEAHENCLVDKSQIETYVDFRMNNPKPSNEDAHLRHILRFYITRAFVKTGAQDVYILPAFDVDGQKVRVDVMGVGGENTMLAITEPESVTPETESILASLKELPDAETVIVYSSYGEPGNVPEEYKEQIDSKQFRLMAVVPPPFDDVYEYDIWMFETTFRELYAGE